MNNVNMTINSNAIQSLAPPLAIQVPAMPASLIISVSFSARFNKEDDALSFAKIMLQHIQDFGA